MNRFLTFSLMLGLPGVLAAVPVEPRQDLLRFANGDQLHGSFSGIKEGLLAVWQREDLAVPSEFKTTKIHKIILRGARPTKSNESLAHVGLVTGDRIPGTLTGLDAESVTVATTMAGVVRIPRGLVEVVAPAPLGGRVTYHGPYSEDGWLMINADYPDGIPPLEPAKEQPLKPADKDGEDENADKNAEDGEDGEEPADVDETGEESDDEADGAAKKPDPNKIARWGFSGAAWYWNNKQGTTGLVRKSGMGERSVLRFNLAWRNRPMVCVAFHADFAKPVKPEPKAEDGDKGKKEEQARLLQLQRMGRQGNSSLPGMFGNSYVLQINAGYAMLMRCGFDADGNEISERLQMNNAGLRLSETGTAAFELRCDRNKGRISLYVDGTLAMEWKEPGAAEEGGYAGKGDGFGFATQIENTMVRISDVVVAEWNGMPDAARSMQSDDQDIVLLANGTDRYSGKVTGLQDGNIRLRGKFGDFLLPLEVIAEVRFAANGLTKPAEPVAGAVTVRIDPIGNLTGLPVSGDARRLKLATAYAGEIEVDLESAVMLDFESSTNYLDDWDQPL